MLVVEIVSPGSRGTDHVMKLYEYAKAGIENYWIIDPDAPRFGGHDLVDQVGERGDAGCVLAATEDFAAVNVVGGQIGHGAAAVVIMVDRDLAGLAGLQGRW